MKTNIILQGDALKKLKELPDESINCVMTSPPYWALRDYGTDVETIWDGDENCEHDFEIEIIKNPMDRGGKGQHDSGGIVGKMGDKTKTKVEMGFCRKCGAWKGQLGLEPTFDLFIKHLCDIFDEVKRVLRKDGTCWVNIGDTYFNSAGRNDRTGFGSPARIDTNKIWKRPSREAYTRAGIKKNCLICGKEFFGKENSQFCSRGCLNKMGNEFRSQNRLLPDKCLTMIPMRFTIEMVNRGWILRNTIIWWKPNCMPSSVKDRFTVDFEYVFFFVKNKKYWFETQYEDSITGNSASFNLRVRDVKRGHSTKSGQYKASKKEVEQYHGQNIKYNHKRNKRTVWSICPKPFKEAHFAVYPEELCYTPIKAGCPEFVCVKCGNPKVMEIEIEGKSSSELMKEKVRGLDNEEHTLRDKSKFKSEQGQKENIRAPREAFERNVINKGYKPTCSCNAEFEPGIVLDPFFGAGTTGLVALKQNKRFIGIELNPEYIEIAKKRLKPYLGQKKLINPSD